MSKQPEVKASVGAAQSALKINQAPELIPVIYADRVINAGFGPGVCRLALAMETGIGTYTPTATLILPTPALLEAMAAVLNAFQGETELKSGVLKGLDAIKEQISAIK